MKQCPKCNAAYADDTLAFCLEDGTPLGVARHADLPTEVYSETELVTTVRPGGTTPDPRFMESQVTRVGSHLGPPLQTQTEPKKSSTALAIGVTAAGMLLLFAIVGIAALFLYWNSGSIAGNEVPKNTNGTNIAATISPTPTSSPVGTQTPSTPKPTPSPTPVATPTPLPERASYPSTTRLKFARGAYTTSFSGQINSGDDRSLVLACRAGQSLSASISGGGSCVTIRGGGSSMRTITGSGDNYITVHNSCSNVVRFSITITVI